MVDLNVTDAKDAYRDFLNRPREMAVVPNEEHRNHIVKTRGLIRRFEEDKRSFSYNPYRLQNRPNTHTGARFHLDKKRVSFEKKDRENDLAVRTFTFMEKKNLLAVALFNFEVVLLEVRKEFNKVQLAQHARIKVPKEPDRKKNEVVEAIAFHHHEIFQCQQLLVLIRVEGYSYVRCFNLQESVTQKGGCSYSLTKEVFCQRLPFEAVTMAEEDGFGFHVIGKGGWLHSYKDDLTLRD